MGLGAEYFHPVSARKTLVEGPFSAVLLMASSASGGKLSLVEHPLAPHALGSPMNTHSHEDEDYFARLGDLLATGWPPSPDARQALGERFGLDLDAGSIPRLVAEQGLRLDP